MILDHKTGEQYICVLYKDAVDVYLLAEHGESHIGANQFAETIVLESDDEEREVISRYEEISVAEPAPAWVTERQKWLRQYAERNGGQISVHIETPKPGLTGRLATLFKPR